MEKIDGPGIEALIEPPVSEPEQWRLVFLDASKEQQLRMAKLAIENAKVATVCFQMNHSGLQHEVAELRRTLDEQTKAQISA